MNSDPLLSSHQSQQHSSEFADEYVLHQEIGRGGQAVVYLGSKNYKLFAIKIYFSGKIKEDDYQIQADFLSRFNFPHLINLVEHRPKAHIQLRNAHYQYRPIIVLQLADGFSISEYISRLGRLPPNITRYYAKQLIATIKYFADQNIAHRDIKPQNILLDSHFNIKLCDFGFAFENCGDGKIRSIVGTQGYRSPEMQAGNYNPAQADIFAIGVVIFYMFAGRKPFNTTKPHSKIYGNIRAQNFISFWRLHEEAKPSGFYPQSFKRLMNSFFNADPRKRPTFQQLQKDQWLNEDTLYLLSNSLSTSIQDQVQACMKARYQTLYSNNPVQNVRRQLLSQQQEARPCKEQTSINKTQQYDLRIRDEINVQSQTIENNIMKYYKQNSFYFFVYFKAGNVPESQFLSKQIFIKHFVQQISLKAFSNSYLKEIQIRLLFQNKEETGRKGNELNLTGSVGLLVKGGVGVQWKTESDNQIWLSAVQGMLKERLSSFNKSQ